MAELTLKFSLSLRCEKKGAKFPKLLTRCPNRPFHTHPFLGYLMFQKANGAQSTPYRGAILGSQVSSTLKAFEMIVNIVEHFPRGPTALSSLQYPI